MMLDVWTVAWKEWLEQMRVGGGVRGAIVRAVLGVGILGIVWPWMIGRDFVTTYISVAFASLSTAMYVSALVPDAFPGERERHTLETLLASRLPDAAILMGKMLAIVSYAWVAALIMLLLGLLTVNVTDRTSGLVVYPPRVVLAATALSLLLGCAIASTGVVVSIRAATVKQAQQMLSAGMLILFLLPALIAQVAPQYLSALIRLFVEPGRGAAAAVGFAIACIVITIVMTWIALLRFRRSRLILD